MVNITNEVNMLVRDIIINAAHYGLIMSSVNRYVGETTKHGNVHVGTAGVYKDGINQFMILNPHYWTSCTKEERMFLLLHELLHICFLHPTIGDKYANRQLFNIAADIEINQHVLKVDGTSMPGQGMTLEMFNLDPTKHAERGTKWYYDYLQQEMDAQSQTGKKCQAMLDACEESGGGKQPGDDEGDGTPAGIVKGPNGEDIDTHQSWKEFEKLSDSEKRLLEGQVATQMARAMQGNPKHCGNLPGTLKDMINEITNPKPTYNWKNMFRRLYTGYADTTYLKKTRKRESIRFPGMPAVKIKKHSRVLCAIDTSGSISMPELVEFFTEVEGMRRAGVEIVVAECDTRIPKEGIYKFRNLNTIKNRAITGGGGTSFEEPIKYLNERSNQFNMLIYLTDGYASVPRTKSMKPIVWVLSRNGHTVESFTNSGFPGYIIKIQDPQ